MTTLFATASTATGDSPYKVDPNSALSSGKGYYATSVGASVSKVLDPAVVFGSLSYTGGFDVTGLDQVRAGRVLTEVRPGDSIGFSMGLAYSLSYDLSISCSYSESYSLQSQYVFSNGDIVGSQDSTSATFSTSLGIRMSPQRIVNVGFSFGLTPESPNVGLSLSSDVGDTCRRTDSLRRPAGAKGVIQFPFLQESELLGVIQLAGEGHDYRDQAIAKIKKAIVPQDIQRRRDQFGSRHIIKPSKQRKANDVPMNIEESRLPIGHAK